MLKYSEPLHCQWILLQTILYFVMHRHVVRTKFHHYLFRQTLGKMTGSNILFQHNMFYLQKVRKMRGIFYHPVKVWICMVREQIKSPCQFSIVIITGTLPLSNKALYTSLFQYVCAFPNKMQIFLSAFTCLLAEDCLSDNQNKWRLSQSPAELSALP